MTVIKCLRCKESKQASEYNLWRGRLNKSCKECRIKNNSWYAQDLGGRRTNAKKRYFQIKDKIAGYRSDLRLDRKYSLSRTKWNQILKEQDHKCGICKIKMILPCVDHNHFTNQVRGLLCRRCNLDLQVIEKNTFLNQAQIYLNQWSQK